jgi:uncharacterized protein (TIGR03437 family)
MRFGGTGLIVALVSGAFAQTPVISTVAGTTQRGFSGDNGPAGSAMIALANLQNDCDPLRFEQTSHISVDAAGNLYIADSNNQRIRRVAVDGTITTIAGSGEPPVNNGRCEPAGPIGDSGSAREARLYNPSDVLALPNGNLIIADQLNNRIRQVSPSGVITTIAGNGTHNLYAPGIPATSSPMDWPSALAVHPDGTIYFAELHGNRVARIGADGRLSTVAGNGFPGFAGDGGPASSAQLRKPAGIAIDSAGNLFIADTGNHRVRKVTPDGTIRTIAGDGALNTPMDVKVDAAGNVYIADTGNHRVRVIATDGVIRTVAGTDEPGRGFDFTDAAGSALNSPSALAMAPNGDLYIADWQNFLIRKISFRGDAVLTPGGVVDSASFRSPVAPGSIVTFFGANLVAGSGQAGATWPRTLAQTTVEVNSTTIPLYFVSTSQVIGQLPFEIPAGTASAVVNSAGRRTNSVTFQVAATAPRIFMIGAPHAAALNQDGAVNTREAPESRGNVITIFMTGLGAVDPPVATAQLAPASPLSRPVSVASAVIGGLPADVLFVGLAPGFIGLAQANLRIPEGAAPGADVPVTLQVGVEKSNVATIAVR